MKKETLFCLIIFVIILMPFVSAEGELLEAVKENVNCKAKFTHDIMESMSSSFPNAENLVAYSNKIQGDIKRLEMLAKNKETEAFKDFLNTQLKNDIIEANEAIISWRKQNKGLTEEQKNVLKTSYNTLRTEYDSCNKITAEKVGELRVQYYEDILKKYEERNRYLKQKGIDIYELENRLKDARTKIIIPLRNELKNAKNPEDVKKIIKKYCLFSGCNSGINYHFAANYEVSKCSQALNQIIKSKTEVKKESLKRLTDNLNDAKSYLKNMGDYNYNEKKQLMWESIGSMHSDIKSIRKELRERRSA